MPGEEYTIVFVVLTLIYVFFGIGPDAIVYNMYVKQSVSISDYTTSCQIVGSIIYALTFLGLASHFEKAKVLQYLMIFCAILQLVVFGSSLYFRFKALKDYVNKSDKQKLVDKNLALSCVALRTFSCIILVILLAKEIHPYFKSESKIVVKSL